jgi:hypothetical protein
VVSFDYAESAGLATGSSDEFDIDRYAVQKIPTVATKGCGVSRKWYAQHGLCLSDSQSEIASVSI